MGKLVTEEIRHKIIALRQGKISYPAICKQLNLKNPSTPRTIWNSYAANATVLPKPKPVRPKSLSKRDGKFLLRKVQKDKFLSIQKLRTEFNSFSPDKTVSHCTIRRLVARHNLIGGAAAKKLMLRANTRQERLRWCRQRRQFGADYWKQFVFTDECRFKLRSDGEATMKDTTLAVRYHPSTIAGRFTFGVPLLIKALEKRNSLDYIHILEEAGVQFFPELGYELVDDNAPIHRSHAVNEWKSRNGIKSVPWPAHSPDLNPIENVWAFMKTQCSKHRASCQCVNVSPCLRVPLHDETAKILPIAKFEVIP